MLVACSTAPAKVTLNRGAPAPELRLSVDASPRAGMVRLMSIGVTHLKPWSRRGPFENPTEVVWVINFEHPPRHYSAAEDAPLLPVTAVYGIVPNGFYSPLDAKPLREDSRYEIRAATTSGDVLVRFRIDEEGRVR